MQISCGPILLSLLKNVSFTTVQQCATNVFFFIFKFDFIDENYYPSLYFTVVSVHYIDSKFSTEAHLNSKIT